MSNLLKRGVHRIKRLFSQGALILVYHRISDAALDPWSLSVSPEHFAEHLSVLQRSFHPIRLQTLARSLRDGTKLRPKSVVITFDDGYADNLHVAKPILEHFDCPATIFLVTGVIGSPHEFWWDELSSLLLQPHPLPARLELPIDGKIHSWQLGQAAQYSHSDYSRDLRWRAAQPAPGFRHELYKQIWHLMQPLSTQAQSEVMHALRTWAGNGSRPATHRILTHQECLELAQSEQIEIGAHTVHHSSLASLSCDFRSDEISGSKRDLEKVLNLPVMSFSYPFGKRKDYDPETVALVQKAGFSAACCNESGLVVSGTDPFQLPRIHAPDCGGSEFEKRLLSKFYA